MTVREVLQKYALIGVVAFCGGYLGVTVREWLKPVPSTVEAMRFEVLDSAGKILSFWGPDNDPKIPPTTPKGTLLVFMNAKGARGSELGSRTGDNGPTLNFYDRDGRERVRLALSQGDDPRLGFSSTRTEGTVLLGTIEGDVYTDKPGDSWGLRLRSGNVRSSIIAAELLGIHAAGVTVVDEQGKYHTFPPDQKR